MSNLEIGRVVGDHFELLERAGAGAFGEVWRARNTAVDKDVALKFLVHVPRTAEGEDLLNSEQKIHGKLTGDKEKTGASNIVEIYDAQQGSGDVPPFLVLEWVPGGSLRERLRNRQQLGQEEVLRIAVQLSRALVCAQQHRVVHGDLKPSNVLVSGNNRMYKLSDFGLARRLGQATGETWGTFGYMSPEQFVSPGEVGHKSDVYSLGALLYQCIEGRLPFPSQSREEYEDRVRKSDVPEIVADVPQGLKKAVMASLARNVQARPDPVALLDLLRRLKEDESEAFSAGPNITGLQAAPLQLDGEYRVVHVETGIEFEPMSAEQCFIPMRCVTNKDFAKFLHLPEHQRWRPAMISPSYHDGGYLQHWFRGWPLSRDHDVPLSGICFDAARDFAHWLGGRLPTCEEMAALFDRNGDGELVTTFKDYADTNGLEAIQFWCSDEFLGGTEPLQPMWRYLPDSPFGDGLSRTRRRRFYCFPHYLFLAVLSHDVGMAISASDGVIDVATPSDHAESGRSARSSGRFSGGW